jgi:ribosomal protein L16 Arg81 hydroxylase
MVHDLDWLLGSVGRDQFFDRYFEKELLHISDRDRNYYENLFSEVDLDKIIAQSPEFVRQHVKHFRESYAGSDRESSACSDVLPISPNGTPSSLREAHQRGYTLVVRDMFRAWLPVAQLTREFQAVFFARLEVHLFVTPARAQGLAPHYDSDDSFVLQISGAKDWKIFNTEVALPIGPQGHLVDAGKLGEPSRRLTMRPGDLLYVPRGLVHAACTTDAPSMHLTFGVFPYCWHDLLCDLMCGLAEQEVSLRRSVPLSALREGALGAATMGPATIDELASLLRYCQTSATLAEPIQSHVRQFIDELPMLESRLFDTIPSELSDEQLCARRSGMVCCVHDIDGRVALKFPGGGVSGPASIRPAFEFIASKPGPFRLGDLPGGLTHQSKQVLMRRLLRDGLLFLPEASCTANHR